MEGGRFEFKYVEMLNRIRSECLIIAENPRETKNYQQLLIILEFIPEKVTQICTPFLLSAFFPFIKGASQDPIQFPMKDRQAIVEIFTRILETIKFDKLTIFFNIYGFLLFELYDLKTQALRRELSEEYKLALVNCTKSLIQSVDSSQLQQLYDKTNVPKLSQLIHVLLVLARYEKFKTLQIAAIECLMAIAQVLNDHDLYNTNVRNYTSKVFLFFLPGIATELKHVALLDEKYGHGVPCIALKAWGRIVTLLMQDFETDEDKNTASTLPKQPWENEEDMKKYIEATERTPDWLEQNDEKLQVLVGQFFKLTTHSHWKVRQELLDCCQLLVDFCMKTMPKCLSKSFRIVIALTEDEDPSIARSANVLLAKISGLFTQDEFKNLLEGLEEEFFTLLSSLPRIFNGVDEKEQIVALNLLTGFVTLFGKHNLTRVLHSSEHLNILMRSLIHISEFDATGISVLEEQAIEDLEGTSGALTYKKFRYFDTDAVVKKIEKVLYTLATFDEANIVYDYLINVIVTDKEHRKEAIFLMNSLSPGISLNFAELFKDLINTYTEETYWYLPIIVTVDEYGYEQTLSDARNNILQICLLVEGVGQFAKILTDRFQRFLLRTFYLILERAGSGHPLIKKAGTESLSKIAKSQNYSNISEAICKNIDYFSFHLERNLKKPDKKEHALNVLAVVLKYNAGDDQTTVQLFQEMLYAFQRNEQYVNAYLRVFKMFLVSLANQKPPFEPPARITKEHHENKLQEPFQVSNVETNNCDEFADSTLLGNKTAEEMYTEDLAKSQEELQEELYSEQEYKKPVPPKHVGVIIEMLRKSLHFLPSKDRNRKLLTLDLIDTALPFLHGFDDDLLPTVHQVWSPLVDRIKEIQDPLVVIYALALVNTMARLTGDFIRSRVSKEALPTLLEHLKRSEKESRLKDRGSAYRQSQAFKLQLATIDSLSIVLTFTDAKLEDFNAAMENIMPYVSTKQPKPLQESAKRFIANLIFYDRGMVSDFLTPKISQYAGTEYEMGCNELLNMLN